MTNTLSISPHAAPCLSDNHPGTETPRSARASYASTTLSQLGSPTEWVARHYYGDQTGASSSREPASRHASSATSQSLPDKPRSLRAAWKQARANHSAAPSSNRMKVAARDLPVAAYSYEKSKTSYPSETWYDPNWKQPPHVKDIRYWYTVATNRYDHTAVAEGLSRSRTRNKLGLRDGVADVGVRTGLFMRGAVLTAAAGTLSVLATPVALLASTRAWDQGSRKASPTAKRALLRYHAFRESTVKPAIVDLKRSFQPLATGVTAALLQKAHAAHAKAALRVAQNRGRTAEQTGPMPGTPVEGNLFLQMVNEISEGNATPQTVSLANTRHHSMERPISPEARAPRRKHDAHVDSPFPFVRDSEHEYFEMYPIELHAIEEGDERESFEMIQSSGSDTASQNPSAVGSGIDVGTAAHKSYPKLPSFSFEEPRLKAKL